IIYASENGNHVFTGDLIDITDARNINLTDLRKQQIRVKMLEKLDPTTFITYPATVDEQSQIYVFTDISCGYCKNFHKQIQAINTAGITVHYLAFPRSGPDSATARLMDRAWCSSEPEEALTTLKDSGSTPLPAEPCESPV